jgi:two-component system heavy metal sensor histidine kinase CusS
MLFDQLHKLRRTLRFRLTLWYTIVFFLALLLVLIVVRIGAKQGFLHETDQRLEEDFQELVKKVTDTYPKTEKILDEFTQITLSHKTHGMFIHLADAQGKIVVANVHAPYQEVPFNTTTDEIVMSDYDEDRNNTSDIRIIQGAIKLQNDEKFFLRVGTSLNIIQDNLNQITRIVFFIALFVLFISPLGGYLLASRATRPIADIIAVARKLQPSRLSDRLPISGANDELDDLSNQINDLLDRLANYVQRHRNFTANAAHELRSPLAALKSTVDVAMNEERSINEYQELLETISSECENLQVLANQLLTLAETDAERPPATLQLVSLHEIVLRSVEMFQAVAEDKRVSLHIRELQPIQLHGDAKPLRQIVNNLIDNALKFNRPNGQVIVSLKFDSTKSNALLIVRDTGNGIAPEDLQYLFERFYRGDKAHTRNQVPGNGLGLSICYSIVSAMHGKIDVTSELDKGSTFTVTLPLTPEEVQSSETLKVTNIASPLLHR